SGSLSSQIKHSPGNPGRFTHLTEEVAPSTTMQEQLRPMLRLILDNESKVKQLLQIRMDELAKLVGQSSVQKSVLSAYGDQGGFVLAPQDNFS
uniref:flagellar protein FliT n=1 Tax=Escherichia coli TaxID=562 RepID=UPI000D081563